MSGANHLLTVRLGASNVYLVPRDGGYLAIDAGADYDGAWRSACDQLAAYGVAPEAVHTVLITHGHLDHGGLSRAWQRRGARIVVGCADAGKLRHGGRDPEPIRRRVLDFLAQSGVPRDLIDAPSARATRSHLVDARDGGDERLGNLHSIRPEHGVWPAPLRLTPCRPNRCLAPSSANEGLPNDAFGLTVHATPGHTPGSVCFFDEQGGDLFTGDHVLEKIAPTAGIAFAPGDGQGREPRRVRALPQYLRSLAETRLLRPARVLPGHGEPFTDLAGTIDRIVGVYEQRAARLLRRLREGPATAWELALRLYPHLRLSAAWLIMAEITGLLDLLEERGQARPLAGDLLRYEAI